MIDAAYVQRMACYNRWQNASLYGAADSLSEAERRQERGAFFGTIHKTLSHLLWGDRMWMSRFTDVPAPQGGIAGSITLFDDWGLLRSERVAFDDAIERWADGLDPSALEGDLTWFSGAAQREITKPKWLLVTHMFNHQTHHRGQVHCMLTQAGGKPQATDLPFMAEG